MYLQCKNPTINKYAVARRLESCIGLLTFCIEFQLSQTPSLQHRYPSMGLPAVIRREYVTTRSPL